MSKDNKNHINKSIKLTPEESNAWMLRHGGSNADYHFKETDEFWGTRRQDELIQTKNGKTIYVSERQYGGFYYLGSLLALIFLGIAFIGTIYSIIQAITIHEWVTIVVEIILVIPFIALSFYLFLRSFLRGLKAKRNDREAERKGLKQKNKLGIGAIIYRVILFMFLGFMAFMLIGLFSSILFGIDIMQHLVSLFT